MIFPSISMSSLSFGHHHSPVGCHKQTLSSFVRWSVRGLEPMTWARSQGIKEQGREPGPPILGSYAFLLVLFLNPERMMWDLLPERCLNKAGAFVTYKWRLTLHKKTFISIHLLTPTTSWHLWVPYTCMKIPCGQPRCPSVGSWLNRLLDPHSGVGGHTTNMDTVGADLKTSLGRVNEKGKTRNSVCGMLPCEKSQEMGWNADFCAFICIQEHCKP